MPATARQTTRADDARQRAVMAQQALQTSELIGAEHLSESAYRLNRTYERLSESGPRVSRGRNRRHAPVARASIPARRSPSGKQSPGPTPYTSR